MESYTTAFFWGAVVFLAGAVIYGLLFDRHVTAQPDAELGGAAPIPGV